MLIASGLPKQFWGLAVLYAIWLRNRTPTKKTAPISPYERLTGNKPDLRRARPFGTKVSAALSFSASTAPTAQATCETARQLDDTKDYAVREDDSQEELPDVGVWEAEGRGRDAGKYGLGASALGWLDMIVEAAQRGNNDLCGGVAREASTAP
ncbi:hypothetical protein B0H14DRAFT_3435163 [Mycena olivaceomarginata]|nr:hypothetical protein B0H14DRAFT_3435163 [Mycena olivaceomarginata]